MFDSSFLWFRPKQKIIYTICFVGHCLTFVSVSLLFLEYKKKNVTCVRDKFILFL